MKDIKRCEFCGEVIAKHEPMGRTESFDKRISTTYWHVRCGIK